MFNGMFHRLKYVLGFAQEPARRASKAEEVLHLDEPAAEDVPVRPSAPVSNAGITIFSSWAMPDPIPQSLQPDPRSSETEAPTEHPAKKVDREDRLLFRGRRHFKYFLKHGKRALIVAAVLLGGLLKLLSSSPSPPGELVLALLVGLTGCSYFIYRSYYEWKHLILEITLMTTRVLRAESRWLMLGGGGGKVPSSRVHSIEFADKTVWELLIFRNSRTVTIDTQVGRDDFLHDMTDTKNAVKLGEAIEVLINHYSHL